MRKINHSNHRIVRKSPCFMIHLNFWPWPIQNSICSQQDAGKYHKRISEFLYMFGKLLSIQETFHCSSVNLYAGDTAQKQYTSVFAHQQHGFSLILQYTWEVYGKKNERGPGTWLYSSLRHIWLPNTSLAWLTFGPSHLIYSK